MKAGRDEITYVGPFDATMETSLDDLQEFIAIGGVCRCEREGWIDRYEARRKWRDAVLGSLQPRLRC
ncbi:hypothetical protein GGE16_003501 [Rhizobium leguminosarum]|uniref:Uncharacterized protein n=1 Tax=Rhizobium leguminosarum TaxID=384 RepID=A0AAE2MLK5_RHILE|nr:MULTISPECIES: hypothetical protein [Rhizobium]MBB4291442.1 hypothetical protein [Rhizobium leguminosarum]MBB4296139.1 hypothetical protein [Rhizobium leguminosarum]MBB4308602.1 hypothetical protein [Rhizobium leguminosarum]MBB4416437.1 hypothetical protein [Rhizobium leguminosarum]MBB4430596.1 hypothetical protein [Rhizobium esperanzae]